MAGEQFSNRLLGETSPYLRQHAHNPVDWYPWGDEALAVARQQNKPILLSVGYSACHWCHVMERESFENPEIAALMNRLFVNIKVDREERPDLDEIYMGAVQAMTGSGGWPMTVFLTPDLRPFYGGTYYPPEDRYGRVGFPRVLRSVAGFYRDKPDQVEGQASRLVDSLRQNSRLLTPQDQVGEGLVEHAVQQWESQFDRDQGGFGQAPKFPPSMAISLLLRHYSQSGDAQVLHMACHTLDKMARGGLYDHLGGGFHRYSVDAQWLVPHFEKMLYDNALLTWTYLEAYQVTGSPLYRQVVEETLDYVRREMVLAEEGGFCAAQDADTEGEEGKFFVWRPEEVEKVLGAENARLFMQYYDVSPQGNFEGKSILHIADEIADCAQSLGVGQEDLAAVLKAARPSLFAARKQRVAPGRDDKVLVAWNGLMISAMARAYQVLGRAEDLAAAQKAGRFILAQMVVDGQLLHTYKDGKARLGAYQDDYACLLVGLLDLYEADFELSWLEAAQRLSEGMLARFWDQREGGFFYTEAGAADIIVRSKNPFDNATPSGNGMATLALLRLGTMTAQAGLLEKAEQTLKLFSGLLRRAPTAFPQMLNALHFYQAAPFEVALVGGRRQRDPLLAAVHRRFVPNKVVLAADPGEASPRLTQVLPLLEGKLEEGGEARAYVCRDFSCSAPVRSAEALAGLLK